jgi:hypothetical protein
MGRDLIPDAKGGKKVASGKNFSLHATNSKISASERKTRKI